MAGSSAATGDCDALFRRDYISAPLATLRSQAFWRAGQVFQLGHGDKRISDVSRWARLYVGECCSRCVIEQ